MTDKMIYLSESEASRMFHLVKPNKTVLKIFSLQDVNLLNKYESFQPVIHRIVNFIRLLWFYALHPLAGLTQFYNLFWEITQKANQGLSDLEPVKTTLLKSGIAAFFQPKTILEIGTYLGWGAAAFKVACPKSRVFTLNPPIDEGALSNNPIKKKYIGSFYKQKKLNINQLWGDSSLFDYTRLPVIDVIYIDGDHSYSHVLKDLHISAKMATKAIIVDDYIPSPMVCPKRLVYGYWTHEVTMAVNDFLLEDKNLFTNIYWIVDSKICLLIKK